MSDTPRTDTAWELYARGDSPMVIRMECAKIERDNAALQAKLESETSISDELLKLNTEHCKEKAALRADAATLCAIIDHANPGAWSNGNTHPDGHGPDEGEVLMSNLYSPLRAKYARAAHGADEENST